MSGDRHWSSGRSAVVGAMAAVVVLVSFPALAAVGENFILGRSNAVDAVTSLSGAATTNLRITNSQAGSPALDLRVVAGTAPLKVNSATLVAKLNADRLDGRHASAFLASTAQAADSALLEGRPLDQVRPLFGGCSSSDIPGGFWLCDIAVDIPGPGTLTFSGSADAQYTLFSGSSTLNCHFLVDGYVVGTTYRHAVLTPSQQYGFCASEGYLLDLSPGPHTVSFYISSSDTGNTPLAWGSAEAIFIPSP